MAESSQNNGWVESYLEALVRPPSPPLPFGHLLDSEERAMAPLRAWVCYLYC